MSNKKSILLMIIVAGLIFNLGVQFGRGELYVLPKKSTVQNNLPANLNYSSVEQVYDQLRSNFDGTLSEEKLMNGLKQGLVSASGDPYTEYLAPVQAKEFDEQLSGSFEGIGAELGRNENGNVIIISPIDGYPAKKAGLLPRDVIVEINGENALGFSTKQAVDKIRGKKGTSVKLRIVRQEKEDLQFDIVREEIDIPSVKSEILKNNIGYIKISRFGDDTADLSKKAAESFKTAGVKGVILDVRGNPGGYLDSAVDVSSLWLKQKVVVEVRSGRKVIETLKSRGTAPLYGVETIVLIDEGSASASEITAGALKDSGVAKLLGTKTFGKGSVQTPQNFRDGGLLKITTARWYTPKGKNIDKDGISPDSKVERSTEDIKANRDPQLDEALKILRQ